MRPSRLLLCSQGACSQSAAEQELWAQIQCLEKTVAVLAMALELGSTCRSRFLHRRAQALGPVCPPQRAPSSGRRPCYRHANPVSVRVLLHHLLDCIDPGSKPVDEFSILERAPGQGRTSTGVPPAAVTSSTYRFILTEFRGQICERPGLPAGHCDRTDQDIRGFVNRGCAQRFHQFAHDLRHGSFRNCDRFFACSRR